MIFESGEYRSLGGTTIESSDVTAVTLVLHKIGECMTDEFRDDDDNSSLSVETVNPVAIHSTLSFGGVPCCVGKIEFPF
jgi:hypothetical protein